MSGITAGALTLIGAITILNLVLTLAVIRRVRDIAAGPVEATAPGILPAAGFAVGPLPQAGDLTRGRRTIIMLTPSCPPCQKLLGELETGDDEYARDGLVCVVGEPDELAPIAARLPGYRTVAIGEDVAQSVFGVTGFPAVLSLDGGVVTRVGHELPARVRVRR
jgi:thiol-disulfide isomerase/thioredoxin